MDRTEVVELFMQLFEEYSTEEIIHILFDTRAEWMRNKIEEILH